MILIFFYRDVLSDQEAADLIMSVYLEQGPFEDAARLLVSIFYRFFE